jgi:hypothetical protein
LSASWREANFKQAKSDYEVAKILWTRPDVHRCHALHYLQMSTEKLARAFLAEEEPRWTHRGFVQFLRSLRREKENGWENLGKTHLKMPTRKAYQNFIDSLLPLAALIEELAPTLAGNSPNPEYPWRVGDEILAPVEHDFASIVIAHSHQIKKLMDFLLHHIFKAFEPAR